MEAVGRFTASRDGPVYQQGPLIRAGCERGWQVLAGYVRDVDVVDPDALGRAFLAEHRERRAGDHDCELGPAAKALRFGAEGIDDDTLWAAVLTVVELAADDECWAIGDGLIDESIATRPKLSALWHQEFDRNPAVRAIYRAMWLDFDASGLDYGWWAHEIRGVGRNK